ncbi:MAG: hypothetical protein FWG57_07070 [Endomicrobia bacterium]|nr:hypothetical protein [Endomicrobiia bacterium]
MKKIVVALGCIVIFSSVIFAQKAESITVKRENGGDIAIGYVHDALAFRVALNDLLSLEGSFGFRAGDGDDGFIVGCRALYVLKKYTDFNVHAFGGLNIGSVNPEIGDSSSIVRPVAGAGIEYFLAYNLSISAEMGVAANFQKDFNFVSTYSDWLSVFGFRYYLD